VLVLGVADDRLDRRASAQVALDGAGGTALLAGDIGFHLAAGRRVVAAIAAVGDNAGEAGGFPGSVLTWAMNWPPFERASVVATDTLTPNSYGRCALPLPTHFDLGRVQRIDFSAALAPILMAHPEGQRQRFGEDWAEVGVVPALAHDVA
jgi:hypothetical protein